MYVANNTAVCVLSDPDRALQDERILQRAAEKKRRASSKSKGVSGKMASMMQLYELDKSNNNSARSSPAPTRSSSINTKTSAAGKGAAASSLPQPSRPEMMTLAGEKQQPPIHDKDVEMGEASSSGTAGRRAMASFIPSALYSSPASTTPATTPPSHVSLFPAGAHPPHTRTNSASLLSSSLPSSSLSHPRTLTSKASFTSTPAIPEHDLPPDLDPSHLQSMQQYAQLQQLDVSASSPAQDYSQLLNILPASAHQHLLRPPTGLTPSTESPAQVLQSSTPSNASFFPSHPSTTTKQPMPDPPAPNGNANSGDFANLSFEDLLNQLNNGPANGGEAPSLLDLSQWGLDMTDFESGRSFDSNLGEFYNTLDASSSSSNQMTGVESITNSSAPVSTPQLSSSMTAVSPFASSTSSLSPPNDNRWSATGTSPTQQPLSHPRVRRLSKMKEAFAGKVKGLHEEGGGSALASESENEDAGGLREVCCFLTLQPLLLLLLDACYVSN